MYQIFVVEDELLIRQNIRNIIENMQGPYVFCGEASDGEIALSMMQDLMPDILLTDIRMPFLDGFGLIRHAKAMMPWLKIAIISGFGDFEYAQKAISLGVDQYLLKPVRQADLVRVIEKMAEQVEKSRAIRGMVPAGLDEDEMIQALRQQFIQTLLFGTGNTDSLLERAQMLKLDIVRSHYLTAICSFETEKTDPGVFRNRILKCLEGEESLLYFFNNTDQVTLLAFDNDSETLNERVYRLISILRHELQDICTAMTTVISDEAHRLGTICEVYQAAGNLLKTVIGVAAGMVINVRDSKQVTEGLMRLDAPFGEAFQKKLQYATPEDVPHLLDEVLNTPNGNQFESTLIRYHTLISLMRICAYIMAKNEPESNEKEKAAQLCSQYDLLTASGTREQFREIAQTMLQNALRASAGHCREMNYQPIIRRAEEYAMEKYNDPNISLVSAARHVGMSSAYFSTVFSQTTGRSFIAYLTTLRMEAAKKLLANTDKRLSDIALEIGYNEPNYFSHVFRKSEGMTPKEYRSRVHQ